MQPASSAGKRVRARLGWFSLCFSLVENVALIFLTNQRVVKQNPKQTRNYFRNSIENRPTISGGNVLIKLYLIDEEIKLERVHLLSALKQSGCTTDFYRSGPMTCNVG